MVKQSLKGRPKGTQSTEKLSQNYPITKDKKITVRQLREKIFEKLNVKKGAEKALKDNKNYRSLDEKQSSEIKSLIRQEQVTCSICYDVMVGPVLVECGHVFCLSCIESAFLASQQCPLCRKLLEEDIFNVSTQTKTLIGFFNSKNMSAEEKQIYQQRQVTFASSQAKRKIPCDLQMGDFVDINLKNKWKQAKVQEIDEDSVVVKFTQQKSKTIETLYLNINSRRLARHRTFTKAPPLKPTYFSKDFNFREPVLQYIVERPTFYQRIPAFRVQDQALPIQETARPNWDQFENIQNENNWIFSDDIRFPTAASENIWNPSFDDLEQPISI